jgi:hypothetical protein
LNGRANDVLEAVIRDNCVAREKHRCQLRDACLNACWRDNMSRASVDSQTAPRDRSRRSMRLAGKASHDLTRGDGVAAALHEENFIAIRTLNPRVSWNATDRFDDRIPVDSVGADYRDLLSEANECYFHREYTVALDHYLSLREKILAQSHPELPPVTGITHDMVFDAHSIDPDRLFELSRRILTKVNPGDPVRVPLSAACLFTADEVKPNETLAPLANLGVDPGVSNQITITDNRDAARRLVFAGDIDGAFKLASTQADAALKAGDHHLAADMLAEAGAIAATYASGDNRPELLKQAAASFEQASSIYTLLGDAQAVDAMDQNVESVRSDMSGQGPVGAPVTAQFGGLPAIQTTQTYLVADNGAFTNSATVVTSVAGRPEADRSVGLMTDGSTSVASLATGVYQADMSQLYVQRVSATTLEGISINDIIGPTFVAYIPHLFFYVLPLAIGDTYAALGQYQNALDNYSSVLSYPFLNTELEVPDLWQRMAKVESRWGDDLFRRDDPDNAKLHYETIVVLPGTVPTASLLYQPPPFAAMKDQATQVVNALTGQPATPVNPNVSSIITSAFAQLTKIKAGLNFLGLAPDYAPVGRFRALQAAANYLADGAVAAEQGFIQFRSQAEQQKFERLQLENAVKMNEAALAIEQARQADAALELQAASETRQLTQLRATDAQANLDDWNTLGHDLTSMDAALSWAANAANDQSITYTNVQYDGASHDYSGTVEDFFDTVGEKREWVNYEIQQNRLARQVNEAAAEVTIAETREQQAAVRAQVQQLNVNLAQVRLDGSKEILDYTDQRMFGEDLWFRLAADLEDLANSYLDMAIEAAFLMERAYDVEFDRDLHRIRLDYGLSGASGNGAEGLLGGDYLKRDIASFTEDYFIHARKQNPIRAQVSLREDFPQAFNAFQESGKLEFHTDLELFDRRWPGTYRRKLKRVEVFVQGLIPTDGVRGTLAHSGVSTEWRLDSGAWAKSTRVLQADTMLLSSYQYRRDLAVIQPPDDLLGLFENLGPQGTWVLELPASTNDLDFQSVSDVSVVFYMDADFSDDLRTFTKTLYGNAGGRALVLSSRFQYPDQWFRVDADRKVAFDVFDATFPRFAMDPKLTSFTVRLTTLDGTPALASVKLTVTRTSDGTSVDIVTGSDGSVVSNATTMAPFASWKGATPVDTFTVAFDDNADLTNLSDIQLAIAYSFTYRPDAS